MESLEERCVPSVTTIDFDHDVDGNTILAPSLFAATNPLREIYAAKGVHFSGQNVLDGGAILDQDSNFGIGAHSGRNFLAFNRPLHMANGGLATDPETIQFDTPPTDVSIYVAGGFKVGYFEMDAYALTGQLVAVNTVTTQVWSPLEVIYGGGIDHVVLTIINQPDNWAIFDDLSFGDGAGVAARPETGAPRLLSGASGVLDGVLSVTTGIGGGSSTGYQGIPAPQAGSGQEATVQFVTVEPAPAGSNPLLGGGSGWQQLPTLSSQDPGSNPVGDPQPAPGWNPFGNV
jgi:hypothetical protein